ncbi:hypothetical protein CSW58_07435 [Caulobacter sp. B11]|uniref:hypothetical protein n=1 Tax=Caulobacter sp. B11 TaxID=2048899 RepID=UPI000C12AC56|nr:hypothetical protein [Caulobacter sp. B11]PHY13187.1 hypothetical protein CSW58_07435 [Caulobacter sp. B11]
MIRSTALALSALALIVAAPAAAAPAGGQVRVQLAGKSAQQVRGEIVRAASTVCWQDLRGETMALYIYPSCVRASVNSAVSKINNPAVSAYNAANPAQPLAYAAR